MTAGARTPEELDALPEDAFVLRESAGFHALFGDGAVLVGSAGLEARPRGDRPLLILDTPRTEGA